jgi:hypothetical protein
MEHGSKNGTSSRIGDSGIPVIAEMSCYLTTVHDGYGPTSVSIFESWVMGLWISVPWRIQSVNLAVIRLPRNHGLVDCT